MPGGVPNWWKKALQRVALRDIGHLRLVFVRGGLDDLHLHGDNGRADPVDHVGEGAGGDLGRRRLTGDLGRKGGDVREQRGCGNGPADRRNGDGAKQGGAQGRGLHHDGLLESSGAAG